MHEQCTIDKKKLFVKKSQFSSVLSNVVEKCVSNALPEERAALIREVCQPEAGDRWVPFWGFFGHFPFSTHASDLFESFDFDKLTLTFLLYIQLSCYWSDDQRPVCQLCCPGNHSSETHLLRLTNNFDFRKWLTPVAKRSWPSSWARLGKIMFFIWGWVKLW